jgi:hypothetical protein
MFIEYARQGVVLNELAVRNTHMKTHRLARDAILPAATGHIHTRAATFVSIEHRFRNGGVMRAIEIN